MSDSFAYLSPCNNSWYARAYPRVKNVAVLTEDGAFALFFRPHPDNSRVSTPGNLPPEAKKMLMPGGQPGGGDWAQMELTDAFNLLLFDFLVAVR